MHTSNQFSLLTQLQDGSSRPATGDEIISAAREYKQTAFVAAQRPAARERRAIS
jgi:hypothetical protein